MAESEKAAALEAEAIDPAAASAIDEEDRLRPEFVERVLDAVADSLATSSRRSIRPTSPT